MTIDPKPYREAGLDLIPLKPGSKKPRDNNWPRRDYTVEEIDQAIQDGCNIGVRPGPDWVIADIDPRSQRCSAEHDKAPFECHGDEWSCTGCGVQGRDAYRIAADAGIDTTRAPTVRTGGGGLHVYYKN